MNICISNSAPDDNNYPEESLDEIVFGCPNPVPQLFIRAHANGVDLVRASGDIVARVYVGSSTALKMRAVRFWRDNGLCGWEDVTLVSTSGGSGQVRIGKWERWHVAALRGGKV